MAVIIHNEPQGNLLNAYNNSILEFGIDSGTPARALVHIDNYVLETTPNKGLFYVNLKKVITSLINQDAFTDSIEVNLPTNYMFPDTSLYLEQEITINVIRTNGSTDTITRIYKYLKSVKQVVRTDYEENPLVRFLIPSVDNSYYVTYFEGLPFDISIYSNVSRTATLTNKRTGGTLTLNLSKGVNRLFLSNGENDNQGFEGDLPLYVGINELELTFDGTNKITCFVFKRPVECGVYLKWFNQKGAWSYWRFNKIYSENIKTKSLPEINNDSKNIENTVSRSFSTGKEATRSYNISTGKMSEYERFIVSEIFGSPKVYLYNAKELQPFSIRDWKDIKIKDGNNGILDKRVKHSEFVLNIELPQEYTQAYAG